MNKVECYIDFIKCYYFVSIIKYVCVNNLNCYVYIHTQVQLSIVQHASSISSYGLDRSVCLAI